VEKEVIIGARCTLEDKAADDSYTVLTDNFGDFWFRGLGDDRTYVLTIEKEGKTLVLDKIVTCKDLSLGDIALE
jgi:hypothetical protein